jgi:acetolactate synthase I/II/III large subunit
MNHADEVLKWLQELGYTHCFFVAGGNSMHLLNSARTTMECVPFVHEVSAGIAAEYFNESRDEGGRAFVLVTAGPGLTNLVTALAGAFLESRELLVLGGQVKSSDLASDGLRQRGIQEVNGVGISAPVTKRSLRVEKPITKKSFFEAVIDGREGRPGPVFLEFCLDAQASLVIQDEIEVEISTSRQLPTVDSNEIEKCTEMLVNSFRPVLLIGGGISRKDMKRILPLIERTGIPVMTTWNAADRIPADHPHYLGRPNTWGQRSSNILIQEADVLVAVGTRLGLQQTGFNWQEFVPLGKVIHVDIDEAELNKVHPKTEVSVQSDGYLFLKVLLESLTTSEGRNWHDWMIRSRGLRNEIPLSESVNGHHEGYANPFDFVLELSKFCETNDMIIPCSSGGAFTVMMQAFQQKEGQVMITDKGLASMGYGLAGAIGVAIGHPGQRTVLVEGDGGFSQNLQELATIDVQKLNIKIFVFSNEGYASIRMTQRNYFDGSYLGCDVNTGLGFPDWSLLAQAYGLKSMSVTTDDLVTDEFRVAWESDDPYFFVVRIHPEQTYFPKISSQITASGGMVSAPLHKMSPDLY